MTAAIGAVVIREVARRMPSRDALNMLELSHAPLLNGGPHASAVLAQHAAVPAAELGEWGGLGHASPAVDAALAVQIVSDAAGLAALEPEWRALHARAGARTTVFQSFAWAWHWQACFLARQQARTRLAIATVRRDGHLVAVWPLLCCRLGPLVQLKWLGEPVTQYCDVLADDLPDLDHVLARSWASIVAALSPDLVSLRKVRDDAVAARFLAARGFHVTAAEAAPYLDLASAPSAEAYEERYAAKARKNRRRLMRRLEEQGDVTFSRHDGGPAAGALASAAIAMKRDWVERRGEISRAFLCPRLDAFFSGLAADERAATGCRVSALSVDGEPVSIEIGFRSGGQLLMHVIAHRPDFEKWGVGVLHMEQTLRECYGEGLTRLDLLAPSQPYKLDWADASVPVRDYVQGYGLIGRGVGHAYDARMRNAVKTALQRLPLGLRRHVTSLYSRLRGA